MEHTITHPELPHATVLRHDFSAAEEDCEVIMRDAPNVAKTSDSGPNLAETHGPEVGSSRPSPRFTFASGARPLDGYTIKRGVGAGGFGEVYYATSDAGKDVALKQIQRNLEIELRGVKQCLNLKHPNLLALYDIRYDDEGQAWVVMEFVPGDNLQTVIERHPQGLPTEQINFWWDGLTAGVSHLHDCGIVHRDLKPGNIFLDEATVKVGDYGLSKFISCSRRSGQTQSVGTFHYMAPEIGKGVYGKEIDIYALGIMLFEMVTGRVPFDGESSQEIIMKHLTAQPPVEDVPSPYREVISRALSKDPAARFTSAEEMRAILPDGPPLAAWTPPVSEPPPYTAEVSPEVAGGTTAVSGLEDEPVARAATAAWREIQHSWQKISVGWRVGLLGLGVVLLFANSRWLMPFAGALAVYYIVYLGVRALVISKQQQQRRASVGTSIPVNRAVRPRPQPAATTPSASPVVSPERPTRSSVGRRSSVSRRLMRQALDQKPASRRWSELLASCLIVAAICGILGFTECLVVLQVTGADRFELVPNFLWIVLSSTVASWGVLFLSKAWESDETDKGLRRFQLLVLGFLIGGATYGISQFLSFEPRNLLPIEGLGISRFHASNGAPMISAYLAYFGALFFMIRWWKQADPLRRRRFSLLQTAVVVLLALFAHALCPLPQGFLVLGTASVGIQLAALWLTPEQRKELQEKVNLAA